MQYDGKGKLAEAIADLCGLSHKSRAQIAAHIKQAKAALNITSKSKNLPDEVKLAIHQWHYERLNAQEAAGQTFGHIKENGSILNAQDARQAANGKDSVLNATLSLPPEPPPESGNVFMVDMDTQATKQQQGGNWGGVRQGSGRKPTGRQSVTMRVPVELAGMIGQLKAIGDTQGQAALLARVQELEKAFVDAAA